MTDELELNDMTHTFMIHCRNITTEEEKEMFDLCCQVLRRRNGFRNVSLIGSISAKILEIKT